MGFQGLINFKLENNMTELDNPVHINHFLREVQQDQMSIWLSIHDEIDLTVNTRLMKPILVNVNKITELRPIFKSFNMPYLSFYMDNEYDEYGSFTASENARVDLYDMNFHPIKNPTVKINIYVNIPLEQKTEEDIQKIVPLLSSLGDGKITISIKLDNGNFTLNRRVDSKELFSLLEKENLEFIKEEK